MDNSILNFIDNVILSNATYYDIYKDKYKIFNDGKWYIFEKD